MTEVIVSPKEWEYVGPLRTLAWAVRRKLQARGFNPRSVSRHAVAKILASLDDFAAGRADKSSTAAKILDAFERAYGFADEGESRQIANAVSRLLDEVEKVREREPERALAFVRQLRIAMLGIARGYIYPKPAGGE